MFAAMLIKNRIYLLPYSPLVIAMVAFLCTHAPYVEQDIDPSYLLFGASRPPLYPFFIWLFRWAGYAQFYLIMWAQALLLLGSLFYARVWLRSKLFLSDFAVFLMCLLMIVTVAMHFQVWFIQSEGLALPFFIFAFFALIECFYQFSFKKLFYLSLWASVLVLTRLQFYYFYVLFGLLCVWYLWQRIPLQRFVLGAMILFGSMSATILVDHAYHDIKHGFFADAPYGSLLILVQTLYLAENNAADYFADPSAKRVMKTLITQRNAQHLNQDAHLASIFKPSFLQVAYQGYSRNYLAIQDIIERTLKTSIENRGGMAANLQANQTAAHLNNVLIANEFKKNMVFLLWKFIQCMGGVPLFLFFLILLSVSLFAVIITPRNNIFRIIPQ